MRSKNDNQIRCNEGLYGGNGRSVLLTGKLWFGFILLAELSTRDFVFWLHC
jgi:hypothetical protein